MKQGKWAFVAAAIVSGSLALYGPVASAAAPRASEVDGVIDGYFKAFHSKNLAGMVALSASTIKIVDYGQSFDLGEWNSFMKFSFVKMVPYDVKLSDFNTRIHADIAYTSFHMRGGKPDVPEIGNAVLRRVDGHWRIEFLCIAKQRYWLQWLHNRIAKGQDVSNWWQDYLKENP